jgi:hypothetical protein
LTASRAQEVEQARGSPVGRPAGGLCLRDAPVVLVVVPTETDTGITIVARLGPLRSGCAPNKPEARTSEVPARFQRAVIPADSA